MDYQVNPKVQALFDQVLGLEEVKKAWISSRPMPISRSKIRSR